MEIKVCYRDEVIRKEKSEMYVIKLISSEDGKYKYGVFCQDKQLITKTIEWEAEHDDYWHMARQAFEDKHHDLIMENCLTFNRVEMPEQAIDSRTR